MMCRKPFVKNPHNLPRAAELLRNGTERQKLGVTPLPCGQCLHCRINKRRTWTMRLMLELYTAKRAVFVTLTYNDENLPKIVTDGIEKIGSVSVSAVQKFIKRLRNYLPDRKIRYLAVGEYGFSGRREINPHYHLALFDVEFCRDEPEIQKAWPDEEKGFSYTEELNRKTAQYIVGYTVEKLNRSNDYVISKIGKRRPEFMVCSRRPGIGSTALWMIAQKIKAEDRLSPRVYRELQEGTKKLPLGRYAVAKLSEYSGVHEKIIKADLVQYQGKIAEEMEMGEKGWYDAVVDSKRVQRKQQRRKSEIFRKRKKL